MFEPSALFQRLYETDSEPTLTRYIQQMKKDWDLNCPLLQFFLDPLNLQTDWKVWQHLQFNRVVATWKHLEKTISKTGDAKNLHTPTNNSTSDVEVTPHEVSNAEETPEQNATTTPRRAGPAHNLSDDASDPDKTLQTSMMVNRFAIPAKALLHPRIKKG